MCLNVPTLNSIRSTSKHFAIVIENLKKRKALKREDLRALRVVKAYLLSFLHLMLRYQHLFQHTWFKNSQTLFCGVNAGVFHFFQQKNFQNPSEQNEVMAKRKADVFTGFSKCFAKKEKFSEIYKNENSVVVERFVLPDFFSTIFPFVL